MHKEMMGDARKNMYRLHVKILIQGSHMVGIIYTSIIDNGL